MNVQEKILFDSDGRTMRIVKTQDVEPLLDALKERSAHYTTNLGGAGKYLGSVPPIIAVEWSRQCGAAIGTREWTEYARKMLKSGNFDRLRGA